MLRSLCIYDAIGITSIREVRQIQCELCNQRFSNLAAMRLHQSKIHGIKNKIRNYVEDGKLVTAQYA